MKTVFSYLFLFAAGSTFGWILEVFFRKFFSSQNPSHKWINPGCFTGPYVPLYGLGLCILYSLCLIPINTDNVFLLIALRFCIFTVALTALEFAAGILSIKVTKVRLWDYSQQKGNVLGIICPTFSVAWGALGTLYAFFVHPYILNAVADFFADVYLLFVLGLYFGVFAVDGAHTLGVIAKIKKFAADHQIVVMYEEFKAHILDAAKENKEKLRYFHPLRTGSVLYENLKKYYDKVKERADALKEKVKQSK